MRAHTQTPTNHARRLLATATVAAVALVGAVAADPSSADAAPPAPADTATPTVATAAADARATLAMARRTASPTLVQRYAAKRDAVAIMTATELGVDPKALVDAWARADQPHEIATLSALSQLGTPYSYASSEPGVAFDCSGLTSWAWAQVGASLAHQSGGQIAAAAPRDSLTAQAGDIVHYPGHVMIYLGAGAIVHAPNSGSVVSLATLSPDRSYSFGDPVG